ncbi:MAG: glycoside hydrolase family 15 protein, partial [Nocardioidaceae bacterium]|nr:glycoside hydrolase family 15 protein [Nocardioidaceae bacterium]
MSELALDQYALLSDCGSAALVSTGGSVDWLCMPRFDSPPVFARLLDAGAGHFLVAPTGTGLTASRSYRRPGLVLDTTWTGADTELVVTDALALGRRERGHQLGLDAPGVLL